MCGKHDFKGRPCPLEVIQNTIWAPAYANWNNIAGGIFTGRITLAQTDEHFGKSYDSRKVEHEFAVVESIYGDGSNWMEERNKQLKRYYTVRDYSYGVKVIQKLRREFKLEGDFGMLETLATMVR